MYDDVMLNNMTAHVKEALIRLNEYHASIHNCLFPPNTKAFLFFFCGGFRLSQVGALLSRLYASLPLP